MKEQKLESYFGRKIVIDASMSIYQFLIVVGRMGTEMLTNETGEVTRFLIYFSLHSLILFYLTKLSLADSYFIFYLFNYIFIIWFIKCLHGFCWRNPIICKVCLLG
ncbi:hypothetical protein ES332_D04G108700v1 [Gossypium tomentosum]|uniref:XPG N-terminal domain-containing protein n=1 Tax=Gossypium tomentosum TaxID=34277 RepID=A0A5D2LBN7_GOSTO|nr:hypothetical protein ES332_D04G108700v1 [Gossypium tomentosum]